MNLNDTRKGQGVEVPNCQHAKGAGERPTGGAGWPRRGRPVAILRGLFAQVQARSALPQWGCFGDFPEISGRPAWFKPPGLLFFWNSSEFFWNLVLILLIWFCCAVVKHESRVVVGTHMCTNHINTKRNELEILFYFKAKMGVLLITN